MLNRITFRDTDDSNEYKVPFNPLSIELNDSKELGKRDILDGPSVLQYKRNDQRVKTFSWPFVTTSLTRYMDMVDELRSYEGLRKKINLKTIDYLSEGWKIIKVVSVNTVPEANSPDLRVSLIFNYVDSV